MPNNPSKWQSLPTEAINPASLNLDKAPVGEIIDLMVNEDRRVVTAVQKERERIVHGVEIITHALRRESAPRPPVIERELSAPAPP